MNHTKADTMLPQLAEADIHRWAGPASFSRGRAYFAHGHILDPCRQGNTLRARCAGSRPQPYRVEVELGPQGILSSFCSCPVVFHCKHAVALLLTWLHSPTDFRDIEDMETSLQHRSPAELIALIRKMVVRYPDLEVLLDLPTPEVAGTHQPVDAETIRRHVASAFQYGGDDERGTAYNGWMLHDLIEVGDTYTEHEDWPSAAIVYQLVAEGVLEHYHTYVDHEGNLGGFVNDCGIGLGYCLAQTKADLQRESILRALFEIYHWDVQAGGLGIGDQVPGIILEQVTPRERQTVAQWIQEALASSGTDAHEFRRQAYGGFLLPLQGDHVDDESYLRLCRETARWQELVAKLLTLGRENEALSVAAQVDDFYLPRLADSFVAQGYADQIKTLLYERAQTTSSPNHQFYWWLKKHAQEEGDCAEELSLQEILFWKHPTVEGYQELHALAEPLGRWDDLRSDVLARLDAA